MAYKFDPTKINKDAFQQSEHWYDEKGRCHVIKDMPKAYVRNVITFLYLECQKLNPHKTPLMEALMDRLQSAQA